MKNSIQMLINIQVYLTRTLKLCHLWLTIVVLLENTQGKVVFGGEVDKDTKFISPTVVKDVGPNHSLMSK